MPKLRFRADSQIQPTIETTTSTEALAEPTIETTVTTPTIEALSVIVPPTPQTNWGNSGVANGWACVLAPFPIGTGAGCYETIGGIYTNTIAGSPNYGYTYQLPCIPFYQGGNCFEYKNQAQGSPACESFCLQT